MKHLKTFEKVKEEDIEIYDDDDNNDNFDFSKITKYFVWIDSTNSYHILSLINDNGYSIISTDKNEILANDHLYYDNGEFKDNINRNNSTYIDIDSSNILLRSDDLEECKEFIELRTSQKKYNL